MRLVPQSGILRTISGVGGATVVSQLMALAATPVMSRLFSQTELGRYSLFFSLANILVTLSLFGLTDAIVAAHSQDDAVGLLAACLYSVAITAPILCLLTFAIIRLHVLGYGELPTWAALPMMLEVAAISIIITLQSWIIRARRFRVMALGHLVLGVLRSVGPVIAGFAKLGFAGLVLAEITTRTGLSAFLAGPLRADLADARRVGLRSAWQMVQRYRLFPLFRTPSTFAFNLGSALPPAMVTMIYGLATTGDFALMSTVMVLPTAFVQRAVGDVFLGHFAAEFRRDPKAARRFLLQSGAALIGVAALPTVVLFFWGPPVFAFVFGAKWHAAGILASIYAPALLGELGIAPLSTVLNVVHRPDAKLVFDVARLVGYGCTYLITTSRSLPSTGMIALLATFSLLNYTIYAIVIYLGAQHPRRTESITGGLPAISG